MWSHCINPKSINRNKASLLDVDVIRNVFWVYLLEENGSPSLFAPVMIATLSTCAQLERDNISFRLNSGRKQYVEKGGKLGRPLGSTKTKDKKKEEYKEVISLLHKGYVIRDVARLTGKGISTVQRIKKELVD